MATLGQILGLARERAQQLQLPYAGAVTPAEAHELSKLAPGARIVDVRTAAEWQWVGEVPDAIEIEWNMSNGQRNPDFLVQLKHQVDPEALVMFLCRSGGRSHAAAAVAAEAGYSNAHNILEGFEGDVDANGHRNTVGGWRKAGLPWSQT